LVAIRPMAGTEARPTEYNKIPNSQLLPHCFLKNGRLLAFVNIVKASSRARRRFSAYILDVLLDQRGNT